MRYINLRNCVGLLRSITSYCDTNFAAGFRVT